jgi:H+/gluconate symporter-like permease
MVNTILGILLIVTFIGLIIYCMKGGNLLVGFLVTAILWCIIAQVPMQTVVTTVFEKSVEAYGSTIAVIIFGAWFGRVIVDTGIADYIIKKAVELGGDKPLVVALLLNIVCALIFTSVFGVGSVMAIGMIVLPILFAIGIDKKTAVGAYMLSVAAGMYLNIAYVSQFFGVFQGVTYSDKYIHFAIYATIVQVVVMVLFLVFHYLRSQKGGKVRAWAAPNTDAAAAAPKKSLSWYCILIPFIPIILVAFFKWQPVPSFLAGIILGLLLTGNLSSYKGAIDKLQKTLYKGVSDCGLLIGMLYSVVIFQAAAKEAAPILKEMLGGIIPKDPFTLVIAFCILAPLALFRGPLMIWGSGIALLSILQSMGTFTTPFLFALFVVAPVAIVASSCPTQSWGMWALSYAKLEPKEYLKTNFPWAWIIFVINELLAYFMLAV